MGQQVVILTLPAYGCCRDLSESCLKRSELLLGPYGGEIVHNLFDLELQLLVIACVAVPHSAWVPFGEFRHEVDFKDASTPHPRFNRACRAPFGETLCSIKSQGGPVSIFVIHTMSHASYEPPTEEEILCMCLPDLEVALQEVRVRMPPGATRNVCVSEIEAAIQALDDDGDWISMKPRPPVWASIREQVNELCEVKISPRSRQRMEQDIASDTVAELVQEELQGRGYASSNSPQDRSWGDDDNEYQDDSPRGDDNRWDAPTDDDEQQAEPFTPYGSPPGRAASLSPSPQRKVRPKKVSSSSCSPAQASAVIDMTDDPDSDGDRPVPEPEGPIPALPPRDPNAPVPSYPPYKPGEYLGRFWIGLHPHLTDHGFFRKETDVTIVNGGVVGIVTLKNNDQSVARLRGNRWLDDNAVNASMGLLFIRQLSPEDEPLPRCVMLNSFFFSEISRVTAPFQTRYQYQGKYTKRVNWMDTDIVLIPINIWGSHWCLAAIFVRTKQIRYYDSYGASHHTCKEYLTKFLNDEGEKRQIPQLTGDWGYEYMPRDKIPYQEDCSSCGLFAIAAADCIARGRHASGYSQGYMGRMRGALLELLGFEV